MSCMCYCHFPSHARHPRVTRLLKVGRSLDEGLFEFTKHGFSGGVHVSGMTDMVYQTDLTTISTALAARRPVTTVATALIRIFTEDPQPQQ